MRKIKLILLIFCSVLMIMSCITSKPNQNLYPVLLGSNLKYLPKPLLEDSIKSEIYLSAGYIQIQANNDDENLGNGVELSVSRTNVFKGFNIAYGASFNTGTINFKKFNSKGDQFTIENERFGTFLLQSSFQGMYKFKNLEFRYLSLDLGYSQESGSYKNIRNQFSGNQFYTVIRNSSIFSAGLSTELAGSEAFNLSWAVRFGIGKDFGRLESIKGLSSEIKKPGLTYFSVIVKKKHLFALLDASLGSARVGIGYSL